MGTIKILERTGEFEGIRISKKELLELATKENKLIFSETVRVPYDDPVQGCQLVKKFEQLSIILDGLTIYCLEEE